MKSEVAKVGEMRVYNGVVYVAEAATRAGLGGCCEGCAFKPLKCGSSLLNIIKNCGSVRNGIIWVKAEEGSFVVVGGKFFTLDKPSKGICEECYFVDSSTRPRGCIKTLKPPFCGNKVFKLIPKFLHSNPSIKTVDDIQYTKSTTGPNPCSEIKLPSKEIPMITPPFVIPSAKEIQKLQRNAAPHTLLTPRAKEVLSEALKVSKDNVEYFDGNSWVKFKTTSDRFVGMMAYRLAKGATFSKPVPLVFASITSQELAKALENAKASVFKAIAVFTFRGQLFKHTERHQDAFVKHSGGYVPVKAYGGDIVKKLSDGLLLDVRFESVEILPNAKYCINVTL